MRTLINLCVAETWPGRSTPIAYTHDHSASKGIAKGIPDQVPDCSSNGNLIRVIGQKRHRKHSHVCDAVFKPRGNESVETPKNQRAFGDIVARARSSKALGTQAICTKSPWQKALVQNRASF